MPKQFTQEEYIKLVSSIHQNKYCYDKTVYSRINDKIIVTCPIHGDFSISARNHRRGHGCPQCGIEKYSKNRRKEYSWEEFLTEAHEKHGSKFSYEHFENKRYRDEIIVTCPIHGTFSQKLYLHLIGCGCPQCGIAQRGENQRDNRDSFIEKARKVHGDKYSYENLVYIDSKTNGLITCPIHGDFPQTPNTHLRGHGCPKCGFISTGNGISLSQSEFIAKAKLVHGNKYNYGKTKYVRNGQEVVITCPIHGDFTQTPHSHLHGHGCPLCASEAKKQSKLLANEDFINRAKQKHGDYYDYGKVEYQGVGVSVTIICPKHGEFRQKPGVHWLGCGCPKCSASQSKAETIIKEYIQSFGIEVEDRNRKILGNRQELDLYIPSLKIGIEYDGTRWHSHIFKDKDYHLAKTKRAEEVGVRLLHIYEIDFHNNKKNVLQRLKHILGYSSKPKISARNCTIQEISFNDFTDFVNRYGLTMCLDKKSDIYWGCFNNELLVGVAGITVTSKFVRINKILTNTDFICRGIIGKLINYISKLYTDLDIMVETRRDEILDPKNNVWLKLGFTLIDELSPNEFVIYYNNQQHFLTPKKSKGERIYHIWDSGNLVYELNKKKS